MFSKVQFTLDLSSRERELQNQLHSSQHRQLILFLLFMGESTSLSINTLVQLLNHSLKRTCYQISRDSKLKGLEIFWGPKDVSDLVDDQPGKAASKIHHDQPDLKRSDLTNYFQGMIRRCQKRVELKGVLCSIWPPNERARVWV